MSEIIKAFPLQWPAGWKRTEPAQRKNAQFNKKVYQPSSVPGGTGYSRTADISVNDAVERVRAELARMGILSDNLVISTNLQLRLDGLPRSGQARPQDPGAAVYWEDNTKDGWPRRCMAIDRYTLVEHNLAAIAATLEAMRAIERHGGAEILDRAFTGFTALPPPMAGQKPWREVFGFAPDEEVSPLRLEGAYRTARSEAHPDKGGNQEAFLAVQAAYEAGCRELGVQP